MEPITVTMSSPDLTDLEREAVARVMQTTSLSLGDQIKRFEQAVAEYVGSKHAIGVNSGTSGLHLCMRAAEIGPGDVVITTPFSFVSSTNVILFEGGLPVFVDIDPATGNIDTGMLKQAVQDISQGGEQASKWLPRKSASPDNLTLKALLPVDVFGQPAEYDTIRQLADDYHLKVVEDSCEALGAEYKGQNAGLLGDYGVFAFYPNKQITTGEGGLIVTDDDEAADLMRALRNQGRSPGDTWLSHTHMGYNYRMDELSAALGAAQMTRLDELLQKRTRVAGWYEERLKDIPQVETLQIAPSTTRMSWFVYVIRFDPAIDRDQVSRKLKELGIPNRPYFIPIHLQPYMVDKFGYKLGDYPVTEDIGKRSLAIPFSSVMTEDQVDFVSNHIIRIVGGNK